MINFLLSNIKNIGYAVFGFFVAFLVKRNKDLSADNSNLKKNISQKDKLLGIQEKVINVSENVKDVGLEHNIKRMQDGKL